MSLAKYGAQVLQWSSADLTTRFGRRFSRRNLEWMGRYYLAWPIAPTPFAQLQGTNETAQMLSAVLDSAE
ncbi:MAG: DUF1016 N-terminal domain-containing protein [Planctomycetaceae bacterium]